MGGATKETLIKSYLRLLTDTQDPGCPHQNHPGSDSKLTNRSRPAHRKTPRLSATTRGGQQDPKPPNPNGPTQTNRIPSQRADRWTGYGCSPGEGDGDLEGTTRRVGRDWVDRLRGTAARRCGAGEKRRRAAFIGGQEVLGINHRPRVADLPASHSLIFCRF